MNTADVWQPPATIGTVNVPLSHRDYPVGGQGGGPTTTRTIGEPAKIRLVSALLGAALLASAPAVSAGATESDDWRDLPVAKANPGISEEVITSLPEKVQQSDVKIDPSFEAGSPIRYPDGEMVEGQSPKAVVAGWLCTKTAWGPPGNQWGKTSACNGGMFGHPGYKHSYSWNKSSDTMGCVRVKGFSSGTNSKWYAAGCGNFGGATVPWGNVLANPAAQARSQAFAAGWLTDWSG